MARKTKAQLSAEHEAFLAEQIELAKTEYPAKLMSILERAIKQNFELTVEESKFFALQDRDNRSDPTIFLTLAYSEVSQEKLTELEWSVEEKEKVAAEYMRRETIRRAALNKLTQEEREILGI